MSNLVYLQAIKLLDGVGNKKTIEISKFLFLDQYIIKSDEDFIKLLSKDFKEDDLKINLEKSYRILEIHRKQNIISIEFYNKKFPKNFLTLKNIPSIIYSKGNSDSLLEKKKIAIVGTRNPSKSMEKLCNEYSKFVVDEGFTIVSGLAKGSDSIAHNQSINNNAVTIAVMPSSLIVHEVTPRENIRLFENIQQKGVVISEYPASTIINKYNFIERNRLQSSLSNGLFIIETSINGGTMQTYNFALKQQKPIACISPFINSPNNQGNFKILENNITKAIKTKIDLKEFLNIIDNQLVI